MSEFKGFFVEPVPHNIQAPCTTTVHLDWLQGTYPLENHLQVLELVERILKIPFLTEPVPIQGYKKAYKHYYGCVLGTEPSIEANSRYWFLKISATALNSLELFSQKLLVDGLLSLGFRCTRIDVAIDDFSKTVTPSLIFDTFHAGNQKGYVRDPHIKWISSGSKREGGTSNSVYVGRRGKRGSGKLLRCYDKFMESGGEIDSMRLELEFSGTYSKTLFPYLAQADLDCWSQIMCSFFTGAVDFVDRSFSEVVGDCPRLDWWQAIVGDDASIKISKPRKIPSVKTAINWIKKQVIPTLSVVLDYLVSTGEDPELFFWESYFAGVERQTYKHKSMLVQSLPLQL